MSKATLTQLSNRLCRSLHAGKLLRSACLALRLAWFRHQNTRIEISLADALADVKSIDDDQPRSHTT